MRPELSDGERLQRYRESLKRAWMHNGDANVWPVKLNAAMHLFVSEFGECLMSDLTQLEAAGESPAEIAALLGNPARPYRMIDFTIYSMRRRRFPLAQQRDVVLKLLRITRALKYGSEFNEDGSNIILPPARSDEILRELAECESCTAEESAVLHRLCALLWAYTEAVMFRAHDVTKELHGPYRCSTTRGQLIVKEYLNLRPEVLWRHIPLLPCQSIRVSLHYADNVAFRIEWHNRVYHDGAPLVPSLHGYRIEIDGNRVGLEATADLMSSMKQTIAAISRNLSQATWNERVAKYAEIFWYRKKPLADRLGRDWRPPQEVFAAIQYGSESDARRACLSSQACERLAMLTI